MIRWDQYRWVHKGVYNVQLDDECVIKKRSNSVDGKFCNPKKGNDQFHQWEYWGFDDLFILHYTGDHTVNKHFEHRNFKDVQEPFIRSAPF